MVQPAVAPTSQLKDPKRVQKKEDRKGVAFSRHFTAGLEPGKTPYDVLNWETRTAAIGNDRVHSRSRAIDHDVNENAGLGRRWTPEYPPAAHLSGSIVKRGLAVAALPDAPTEHPAIELGGARHIGRRNLEVADFSVRKRGSHLLSLEKLPVYHAPQFKLPYWSRKPRKPRLGLKFALLHWQQGHGCQYSGDRDVPERTGGAARGARVSAMVHAGKAVD